MPKICTEEGCNNPIFSRKTMKCKYHIPNTKIVAKKAVKKVSAKQQKSNREVSKAKADLIKRTLDEYGYLFCFGCGTTQGRIDCSHLIAIGEIKALEAHPDNLTLHCSDCHSKWELQLEGVEQMNDYKKNTETVKRLKDELNTTI